MENLIKALLKAKQEFKPVQKTATNPFFHSKYAPLASLIEATQEALSKNGLVVIQTSVFLEGKQCLQTALCHESGEKLESATELISMTDSRGTNNLQQQGAARTYLRRYEYEAILGLAAEDDDDGNGQKETTKPKKQPEGQKAGTQEGRKQSDAEIAFWKFTTRLGGDKVAHEIIKHVTEKDSAKDVTVEEFTTMNQSLVKIVNSIQQATSKLGSPITFENLVQFIRGQEPAWSWFHATTQLKENETNPKFASQVVDWLAEHSTDSMI